MKPSPGVRRARQARRRHDDRNAVSVLRALLAVVAVTSLIAACAGSGNAPDLSDGAKVDMGGWSL